MAPKKKSTPTSTGKKTGKPAIKIVRTKKVVAKAVRKPRVTKTAKPKKPHKSMLLQQAAKAYKRLRSLEDARKSPGKVIVETKKAPHESDISYYSSSDDWDDWDDWDDMDPPEAARKASFWDNDARIAKQYGPFFPKDLVDRPLTQEQWDHLSGPVGLLLEHPRCQNMNPPDFPVISRYSYLGYLKKMDRTLEVSLNGIEWLAEMSHYAGDAFDKVARQMRREAEAKNLLTDPSEVQLKKGWFEFRKGNRDVAEE